MSADIGRLALTTVGVIAGFALTGSPFGASIGLALGAGLGFFLFPPEGKVIEGPRLDDLKVSFSSYGRPIPRIYGTMETGGNVVWSPGLVEHRTEEEVGGKGTPSITQVTFLYTASFRINYSVGVADAILKNWADTKLIRDATGTGPVENFFDTSGPGSQAVRDFLGTTTQLPGPAEQADKGIANTPAYRGTVSQEYEDHPLGNYGNRIPQITAEIAMSATESFPSDTLSGVSPNGTNWEWQIVGETFLIDTMTRIDNVGQTVLATNSLNADPRFPCVDAEGNFYRAFDAFAGETNRVDKYDGITLQLLITGPQFINPHTGVLLGSSSSLRWITGRVFGGITLPDGTVGSELIFLHRQAATLIVIASTESLQLVNLFDAAVTGVGQTVTVDSERNLWFFYNSGADVVLNKVIPGSGDLDESFTVTGENIDHITYEPTTNSLILGDGSGALIRWGIVSQSIEARLDGITYVTASAKNDSVFWNGPSAAGILYLQTGATLGQFREFDIINMTAGRSWHPTTDFGLSSSLIHRGMYDPLRHAMIKRRDLGGIIHWLYLDRQSGDNITVRSIVEDVSSLVDLTAGTDIDATALTDTLPGYIIRTRMTARKALEPLATAFNFRSVESDFKIKFPKRGGASVGNIPQIDLGATAGEVPTTQPLKKTRISEDQLFETAIIEYIDPTFDNNPNTQQAKRIKEAIDVGGSLKFDFPGALGNDQAAQIIERILFQAWSGRTNISTAVPLKHILKDPGDIVTITKDGKTVTVELHNVKLGANSIIKIEGTIDDSVVHVSTAAGGDALGVETQTITITGPTEFFILDIPLLRDVDDGTGIYVAAGTSGNLNWPGASIHRGLTTSSLFAFTALSSSRNMDFGFANGVLANGDPDIWDRTNTLSIRLSSGALSSDTEINVLNGANTLLIGDELLQFATAVLEADGTYTISTLLRGRRGTEGFTGMHVVGDKVIVLSTSTVLRVGVDLSDHLVTFLYKAITLGNSQFSSKIVQQILNLRSQMPYAPSHAAGTRPANDWTFTHLRRTRIGGEWKDLTDVPLGEASESYEWDVMDGATVARTLTSATESVTYTEADQITDFGSVQDSVEFNVYQLSATVGRGFVTNKTVSV